MLRTFTALAAVLGAVATGVVAVGPAAAASPPGPPSVRGVPAPPKPSNGPERARIALQLVKGRLDGRRLAVTLRCDHSGSLELRVGSQRIGGGPFRCRDSRASVGISLPRDVATRAAKRRGIRATATASVAGWRTTFGLRLGRRTRPALARASYDNRWTIQAAWCTDYGFQASVDTATLFSGEYGDQVWWRPIGWQHETQSWSTRTYIYRYGLGDNLWDSYTAVPDNGYLIDANGNWTHYGHSQIQVRSLGLWTTRRGVWVAPAIQSWTHRGGYQHRYIRTTTTNEYGEALSDWCYVPTR